MTYQLPISVSMESIHAAAVQHGRNKGFPGEAGRLNASDPSKTLRALIRKVKPEKAANMADSEIRDVLAMHLWMLWLQAELNTRTD